MSRVLAPGTGILKLCKGGKDTQAHRCKPLIISRLYFHPEMAPRVHLRRHPADTKSEAEMVSQPKVAKKTPELQTGNAWRRWQKNPE